MADKLRKITGTYNSGREADLRLLITVADKLRKITGTYNSGREAEEDYL